MITGTVNSDLEGILQLTVRGPHGKRRRLAVVIDTGYNGALTLPSKVIAELDLPWHVTNTVVLGDGSTTSCEVYVATVVWDRRPIRILIDEAETTPLVGTELLQGFERNMQMQHRGRVTIKPLRRPRN